MREIECRAWLKGERKMVEVKTIHFGTRKIMYGYSAGSQNYGNASCGFDDCEIMQFTGLKDKNGAKIYEGDVVEFDEKEWGCKYYEEVKWDYELLDLRKSDYKQWCVVVGNVYDNPELIKESE